MTGQTISDPQLINGMRSLARMHIVSSGYRTDCGDPLFQCRSGSSPAVSFRRSVIRDWPASRVKLAWKSMRRAPQEFSQLCQPLLDGYSRMSAFVDRELEDMERVPVSIHPCWRDLWSEHVLFTGDEVTGFVDPGSAKADHVSSDLSRLLGSLFGDETSRWETALTAYEAVRPLDQNDRQLIRVMDRSSVLLSGLTWIDRWMKGAIAPPQLPAICERVRRIIPRMENL